MLKMQALDILIAVMIDWIIGDPYWFPHPIIYIGKGISFLEKRGRSFCKTDKGIKLFGGLIVLLIGAVSFLVPFLLLQLVKGFPWLYHGLNIFMLWTTLAARCLHKEAVKIQAALDKENIEDARLKLSYIVGRETKNLTEREIIRADVETVAENAADGVLAPLLYAMVGGAPLAMLYKGINTMDSMLGYLTEKYKHIGFFPAKTDDVANFLPARITGILMCFVAPLVGGSMVKSTRIMIRDRKNHKSPNCAYPEGAAAGALRIQLGGTNTYFGEVMEKPTIGDFIESLKPKHIFGVIQLMYGAEALALVLYGILIYFIV